MITWQLWRALQTPFVAHPLYRRYAMWHKGFTQEDPGIRARLYGHLARNEEKYFGGILLVMVIVSVFFGVLPLLWLIVGMVALGVFVLLPLTVLFASTVYGGAITSHISDAIAEEKSQGRYVFMVLTPYGLAGTAWALGSITLHNHASLVSVRQTLEKVFSVIAMMMLLLITVVLAMMGMFAFAKQDSFIALETLLWLFDALVISVIILVDYGQASIIGALVGMLTPQFTKTRAETRAMAVSIFFSIQLLTTLVIVLLCGFLWVGVYDAFSLPLVPTFPVACLVIAYLFREAVITALWVMFSWHSNTQLAELEFVTRVDVRRVPLFWALRFLLPFLGLRKVAADIDTRHIIPIEDRNMKRFRPLDAKHLQDSKISHR
jgi:hypothetical protein